MTFIESVKTCFSKYTDFKGCASRPEYWWFALFNFMGSLFLAIVSGGMGIAGWLGALFSVVTFLPSLAVTARRLHDTNRSGWLQLLILIPLIGWIIMLVLLVQGPKEPNRYNAPPP